MGALVISFHHLFTQETILVNQIKFDDLVILFWAGFILSFVITLGVYFIKNYRFFRRIRIKYLLGYALLIVAILGQANPNLIINPTYDFITRLIYKPSPPFSNSPWSWQDWQSLHPAVVNMPIEVEKNIKSVAKYITQQESDPYFQIKALHDYIISRVSYDSGVLTTGKRPSQDAQTVFNTHKAVCEGYANLFMALAKEINLEVVYIEGKIRPNLASIDSIPLISRTLRPNHDWTLHAWNAVKVKENWYLVDTTWDDNDTSYRAEYLMPPPEVMIISHFPHLSSWQLLVKAENYKSFVNKPLLTPQFFIEDLTLISPLNYENKLEKSAKIVIKSPPNYQKKIIAIARQKIARQKNFSFSANEIKNKTKQQDFQPCSSQTNSTITQITCNFPDRGEYEVVFLSSDDKIKRLGQLKFNSI